MRFCAASPEVASHPGQAASPRALIRRSISRRGHQSLTSSIKTGDPIRRRSSIVAVHLEEPGRHPTVLKEITEADVVACSVLAYAEARSAFARAAREPASSPRLTSSGQANAIVELNRDWRRYLRIGVTQALVRHAGDIAANDFLRAYDAVQLASALALRERVPDTVLFSTWDRRLANATKGEGLSLAHEVNT